MPAGKNAGWFSPDYGTSRKVVLDPSILENNRCICMFSERQEAEHFRMLRTQILHAMRDRGWSTLMVTSPRSGEGKTTTAVNLALTFAREYNHTAILVDCDLKKQSIHKILGYESEAGLVEFLLFDKPMNELIVWPGIEKLTIISGGRTIQDSTELLESRRMADLVRDMKSRYEERFIIFDLPPLLEATDAMAFAPNVDGIVMVVREGITTIAEVERSIELIPRNKFLGFVINGRKYSTSTDRYYGYYGRQG
ncbi:MAG: polysaccharide biosynthesis tyrosine autokinase [Desulfobacterales bacterium]